MSFLKKYAVFGLILIGFAIRISFLNDISVSPDERNVIDKFLPVSFGELLTITTMHGFPEHAFANIFIWLSNQVGGQVFILRWQAVVFAVLTLAVTYKAVQKMLGQNYALAATLLFTFSGYHMLFSHRIRGYSAMIFFAVASTYFLWRGMGAHPVTPRARWRDWLLFALISGLSIYNQLFTTTLLATQGIVVAVWLLLRAWHQRPRSAGEFFQQQILPPLLGGLGGLLVAILLFTPILPQFFRNFVADDSHFVVSEASLWATLSPYLAVFEEYSGSVWPWSWLLFLLLIGVGLIHLIRIKPEVAGLLAGWLVLPILLATISQILIPWFYVRERYIVYMLPAFMILAGVGWQALRQRVRRVNPAAEKSFLGASLVVILLISFISITAYLNGATYGNWQAVSNFLAGQADARDLIVCEPFQHGWEADDLPGTDTCTRNLTYRLEQQRQFIYPIYNLYTIASRRAFTENPILLDRNPRVWVVLWGVPESLGAEGDKSITAFEGLGRTLVLGPFTAENAATALSQALSKTQTMIQDPNTQFALLIRLADLQALSGQTSAAAASLAQAERVMPSRETAKEQLAQVRQHLAEPPLVLTPAHLLSAELGNQVLLQGYSLTPEQPFPGQPLQLTLFWHVLAPISTNYATFLHLRNEANQTVAQVDFTPSPPPSHWWVGDSLNDQRQLLLPSQLPAGQYRLLAGLYDPQTLARLPVKNDTTGENAVELTRIIISNQSNQ
ncbi:MAG: glycosyltransferase family 39 protein [Anaerolineales bacterium]|nr:glycosyltransferase family 39 protein [Anaerolineales bacterium]